MAALSEWPVEPLTDATVAAFLCILGANVGSFLNVVAHRAPRGTSVVRGGSRCPACGSAVRWRDNVPVLGWLLLRGRCRDCGAAIAPRYPLVEAAGMLVGAITSVELLSGGRTWPPGRFGTGRMGADVLLVQADWLLALVCAAHAALLFVLLTWTLFEADRTSVSWRRFLAAAAVLGTLAVAAGGPLNAGGWPALQQAALGTTAAVVVGSPLGNRWLRQALLLVGLVLGWQALLTVAAVMPAVAAARIAIARAAGMRPGLGPSCGDLLGAVGVQVLAWRWLAAVWLRDA